MNIDKLPDDCLLHIFNLLNRFDTLLNCSKVCERWKVLVLERLRNVSYLTDYPAGNTIIFKDDYRFEGIQVSEWFPKLKILAIYRNLDVNFVVNLKVKGLVLTSYSKSQLENVTFHDPSLEMLAISHFCSFFANEIQGQMLKQLYITGCNVSHFARYAKYFPNLKRLHIDEFVRDPSEDTFYTGPVLEKLEILEICFNAQIEPCDYYGFSLADHCPALKSAFHYIETYREFFVDSGIKNHFLEDLVIDFREFQDWSVLRRILSKYPNLKHLAFRGGAEISDENIPELLLLLPRVIFIDIRDSEQVTEKSTEYIDRYCRHHDRSISFYYEERPEITKKWPHLTAKDVCIGHGFDFMKYCFLRNYDDLPLLLDPDE
ncbi:uncharacterized protein LOC107361563 isoform X2 [Tetranychus urticae]|uniref:uncharacterized protein LOC107361563 isoform X2 n=1 Tax=Tetranychus urticae TaxID=32264 RepID=UPI00077BC98D|nr:uncharacterized protein LOC107361563 isoform X2 [Tetranychus urticae]